MEDTLVGLSAADERNRHSDVARSEREPDALSGSERGALDHGRGDVLRASPGVGIARLLGSFLYQVDTLDPLIFLAAPSVLIAASEFRLA